MKNRKNYLAIIILASLALINASYLSYKAYFFKFIDPIGLSSLCDISPIASCSNVLRSPWSEVFGIPFPWIALFVYPTILVLAYLGYKTLSKTYAKILALISFCGILFNSFIIYREIMYIHAYCLLCLMCSVIILSIFIISTREVLKK